MHAVEIMRDIAYAVVFQMVAEVDSEDQILGWLKDFSGPPMSGMEQATCLVHILDIGTDEFLRLSGDLFAEALLAHGIVMPDEVRTQLENVRQEVDEALEGYQAGELLNEARADLEELAKDDPELALVLKVRDRQDVQIQEVISQI